MRRRGFRGHMSQTAQPPTQRVALPVRQLASALQGSSVFVADCRQLTRNSLDAHFCAERFSLAQGGCDKTAPDLARQCCDVAGLQAAAKLGVLEVLYHHLMQVRRARERWNRSHPCVAPIPDTPVVTLAAKGRCAMVSFCCVCGDCTLRFPTRGLPTPPIRAVLLLLLPRLGDRG